jgi:hypothetical protein
MDFSSSMLRFVFSRARTTRPTTTRTTRTTTFSWLHCSYPDDFCRSPRSRALRDGSEERRNRRDREKTCFEATPKKKKAQRTTFSRLNCNPKCKKKRCSKHPPHAHPVLSRQSTTRIRGATSRFFFGERARAREESESSEFLALPLFALRGSSFLFPV